MSGCSGGKGYAKMVEDASDTEEERFTGESGTIGVAEKLLEPNIQMTAREVLDTCRGWSLFLLSILVGRA